jgi:hypothetical protein
VWLEASDANLPETRDQAQRLRSLMRGLDPQVGFFGALGKKVEGRTAAELVVASYRGEDDDLDLAYWDLGEAASSAWFEQHLDDLGWVIAGMNLDVWCLSPLGETNARALCEHLDTNYRLDYRVRIHPGQTSQALLYRRSKSLAVEVVNPKLVGQDLPPHLFARAKTKRGETITIRLLPIGEDQEWPRAETLTSWLKYDPNTSWLILGGFGRSSGGGGAWPWATGAEPLDVLAAGTDQAGVVLAGASLDWVDQMFVSPNMTGLFDRSSRLNVTHDRRLQVDATRLGTALPLAVRLSFSTQGKEGVSGG